MIDYTLEVNKARRNGLLLSSPRDLVLLAPSAAVIPPCFKNRTADADRYADLLESMQALRGNVYVNDGAVREDHIKSGRHQQPSDVGSWHLLVLNAKGEVCGCARYREYPNHTHFSQLNVSMSALANCSNWGRSLRASVDAEMALARQTALPFVELGGWALDESVRGTTEAIRMALSTYGLSQLLGGGVGISTATYRNGSASILRRIGGQSLKQASNELPSYHDPQYGCEMEVLRFYSWTPNPRYQTWVTELKSLMRDVTVVTDGAVDPSWKWTTLAPRGTWGSSSPTVSAVNRRSSC